MGDPLEIELKLEVDPEDDARLGRLAADPGIAGDAAAPECRELVSTYFDTPDMALRAAGYSLRVRRTGDAHVQTVKASGAAASAGLFVRPEWERPVPGALPVLDETAGPLAAAFDAETLAGLAPLFESAVSRTTRIVEPGGARIELAIDRGEVRAGAAREPLCEIELELQEGDPAALFALARRIDEILPVRLGVRSKSERGYALAEGSGRHVARAEPVRLDAEGDAIEAFAAIAHACIRQFRLNEALLLETGEAKPLHQARVGLRRLRSAFSLFKPLLVDDPRADTLRAELRWLAAELGEVRNLDVLVDRCGNGEMRDRLVAARAQAFERVRAELASARTRRLMIDLVEWLAIGRWRAATARPDLARMAVRPFAADLLDARRRKLRKKGRRLAKLDDHRRHQVRIDAKKLRYATELFAALFTGKKKQARRHKAFLRALEGLQAVLGDLNDLATAPEVFATLGIEAPAPAVAAGDRRHLLEQAGEAHGEWADTRRFWR